ncbi:transcriptional regulator [Gandjariella thermophila]|uniref:Transcriptional regulator n=2 Tax=Gandjariella thermophila TaxID=1931992 RepID=A0A4D4J9E5_9PSEU|nr:transcriptional regulator [Gandjariella thermophila]
MWLMAIESDSIGIGAEIRRMRRWRGMTLEALAGQAGISKGYLSKIENGHAALDRRSTLAAIARALRVSLTDLGAEHVLADHEDHEANGAIPDIRFALLATSLDDAEKPAIRSADELATETDRLAEARQACRYSEVGHALPALLTELHATAALGHGGERESALRSLVQAAQVTTLLVKNLGAVDLAWVAAERGHQAATRLGDPLWVAASEFARTQALIGLGAYARADALARKALDLLRTDSEPALEVYGTSVLTAGFCGSVTGSDDPVAAIAEAQDIAGRAEGTNAFYLAFSPTNVDLWRVSIALESDDPVQAAEVASGVDIDKIPMKSRQTAFLIDHARALHALRGRDADVVNLLRQAERLGPTRTRHNIWAREIVAELVQRARRDAGGRELRGLADRMGLLGAI